MNKFVKKMISTISSCLIVLVTLVNTSIKINAFTSDINVCLFGTENSFNHRTFLSEQLRNLSCELKQPKITVFDNKSDDLTEAKPCLYIMCIDLNDEDFEALINHHLGLLNYSNPLPTMAIFWITGFNNCKSEDPNDVLSRIYDILKSRQVPSQFIFVPHAKTNPAKIDAVLFTKNETDKPMSINLQSSLLNILCDTITRFTNLYLYELNSGQEMLSDTPENMAVKEVYNAILTEFAGLQFQYLTKEALSQKDALATVKSIAEENLRLFNDIKNELDEVRKTIKEEDLPKFDDAVKTLQNSQILQKCSDLEITAENIQEQLEKAERIFKDDLGDTSLNSIKLNEHIQNPTDEQPLSLDSESQTDKSVVQHNISATTVGASIVEAENREKTNNEDLPIFDDAVKTLQNSQILQKCSDLETKAENIQDQLEQAEQIFTGNLDATGSNSIKLTGNIQHPTDKKMPGLKNEDQSQKSTMSKHKSQLPNVITSIVKDNVEELIGSRNVIKPSSETIDNPTTILNSLGKSSKSNSIYKKLGLGALITIPIGIIVAFAKNLYTKLKKPDINKQEITHKHEITIKLDLDTAKTSSLKI